jgi:hypothetical protein
VQQSVFQKRLKNGNWVKLTDLSKRTHADWNPHTQINGARSSDDRSVMLFAVCAGWSSFPMARENLSGQLNLTTSCRFRPVDVGA